MMKTRSQTPRVDTTNDVFTYLTTGKYPHGANDNAKRNIRKRAKYFKLKDGELYHLSTTQDNYGNDVARERIVLWDEEERLRKIKEMHIDEAGNHLGRQNLIAKLSKTYYFVGISSKVKQVIQECGLCLSRMRSGSISDGNVSTMSSDVDLDDSDSVISFSEDKPIKSEWPTRSQEALHFWEIVELGVLGPFDCIDSKHYIVVFLDLFSNWPEAFVVDSLSPSVVTHLILNLICRFGCMKTLMIRDHPGFLKDDLTPQQEILQKTGLQITVNQFPSSLSDKTWTEIDENLQNYTENNSHWPHCLEFALMPHRISRAERSEYTPAFITYGRELNLPSDLLKEGSRDESFPSAEPHLSCEDMATITSKFLKAYTTYGKNFQAWNSCSQPFCVIPSMNYVNIQSTPRRKKRGKDVSEDNSDKEAEEDMPPPATEYCSPGKEPNRKRRKRSVSSITRLINADESMDEDEAEPQDPKDKDYTPPNKKMNKVNSEKELDTYYQGIYNYKKSKTYLPGSNDNFKRLLRKASLSYVLRGEKMYYVTDNEERYVPRTTEERLSYLIKAHIDYQDKHQSKNAMAQNMVNMGVTWKGVSVDCAAFAAACPHCHFGEQKTDSQKPSYTGDPILKAAEENYSLLMNYLQKGKFTIKTLESACDTVKDISKFFVIEKGILKFKKSDTSEPKCLEVGVKDRKVAMQSAHVCKGDHFGPSETFRRLSEKYIWNKMRDSVDLFIEGCCKKIDDFPSPVSSKSLLGQGVKFFVKQFENGVVDRIKKEKHGLDLTISGEIKQEVPDEHGTVLPSIDQEIEAMQQIKHLDEKEGSVKYTQEKVQTQTDTKIVKEPSQKAEVQKKKKVTKEATKNREGLEKSLKVEKEMDKEGEIEETEEEIVMEETDEKDKEWTPEDNSGNMHNYSQASPVKKKSDSQTEQAVKSITCLTSPDKKKMRDKQTEMAVISILPLDEKLSDADENQSEDKGEEVSDVDENQSENQDPPTQESQEQAKKEEPDTPKKKFFQKCEICGYVFKGLAKYNAHMYEHTGVKPYECEYCQKKFTLKKSLKFHIGKHTGHKPYLCNLCGKSFNVPSSLRSHIQLHAKGGIAPKHCDICNRTFDCDFRFKQHMEAKHPSGDGIPTCDQCGKEFSSRKSLRRHERGYHQGVKNHFCHICGLGFFRKENMIKHIQKHNSNEASRSKEVKPITIKTIRKPIAYQKLSISKKSENKSSTTTGVKKDKEKSKKSTTPASTENVIAQAPKIEIKLPNNQTVPLNENISIQVVQGPVGHYVKLEDPETQSTYFAIDSGCEEVEEDTTIENAIFVNTVSDQTEGTSEGQILTTVDNGTIYAISTEADGTTGVQYEIQTDQLDEETLSAIRILAQAQSM